MTDSLEQSPSVTVRDVYQVLTSLVVHSEQVRWGRLNTFLVSSSLFVAAWVGVLAGTSPFQDKKLLLVLISILGVVFGAVWTRLGWRSSEYLDEFHKAAFEIEKSFPSGMPRPFHLSQDRRGTAGKGSEKFSTSKWLVAAIPFAFSLFFLVLASLSYRVIP